MTARVLDITLIIWTARTGVISSRTTPGRPRGIIQGLVVRVSIIEARNLLVAGGRLVSPIFLYGIGSVSVAVQNRIKGLT